MKIEKLIAGIVLLAGISASAQMPHDAELFLQLKEADSLLFELGFNQCNLEALENIVRKDLVFLHDQAGIQNREQFFLAVRQNICPQSGPKPVRKLVKGSLEVYPLYSNGKLYGAIQMGVHEFYLREKDSLKLTGVAKFTHTWLLENGRWKLFQVLSYDHQPPKG